MTEHKMPLSRSIICILLSVLFVSGSALMGRLYFIHQRDRRLHDEQYHIVAIVQNSDRAERLNSSFLAEMLSLSIDRPSNFYRFDTKEAEKILETCPLISEASVKKVPPGTLYITYRLRVPYVLSGDYPNTAIDSSGFLFPFSPFFTPKHLPVLYTGEETSKRGRRLQNRESFTSAKEIVSLFEKPDFARFFLRRIDLSRFDSENCDRKQIVVVLEERREEEFFGKKGDVFYLRLGSDHYRQDIVNFYYLHRQISKDREERDPGQIVVDFRIPRLAFIKRLSDKA